MLEVAERDPHLSSCAHLSAEKKKKKHATPPTARGAARALCSFNNHTDVGGCCGMSAKAAGLCE